MTRGKVLAVLTNQGTYGSDAEKTGLWLAELSHFYDAFEKAGYAIYLASPNGGPVPIDPRSLAPAYLDASARSFQDDPARKALLENTLQLSGLVPEEYALVFFAGGHGTMWDFTEDTAVEKTIRSVYSSGGVVAAVCHGVAALVSATDGTGNPLVAGRAITGFSTLEEYLSGKRSKVPYLPEDALKKTGGSYSRSWIPFTSYAVADGRLVTGQNPQSTKRMAALALAVLEGKRAIVPRTNAKCAVCLFGTWVVGLSALAWGIVGVNGSVIFGSAASVVAIIVGLVGLSFLYFQYPMKPCTRCVAAVRTRETLGKDDRGTGIAK